MVTPIKLDISTGDVITPKAIDIIGSDSKLIVQWANYQKKVSYAADIRFEQTVECARKMISLLWVSEQANHSTALLEVEKEKNSNTEENGC